MIIACKSSMFIPLVAASEETSDSRILRFFSYTLDTPIPMFFRFFVIRLRHSYEFFINILNSSWVSCSSVFLQMNEMLSGFSMFLLTCYREGRVNQATRRATFLILWSGSRYSKSDSVTMVNKSSSPFRFPCPSFSSLHGKIPHCWFCVHILISYWSPRWNLPTVCCYSKPSLLAFNCSAMKVGMCWMISMSVMDGRQSSSFLGIMWTSRSLPSARDGVQNYPIYY